MSEHTLVCRSLGYSPVQLTKVGARTSEIVFGLRLRQTEVRRTLTEVSRALLAVTTLLGGLFAQSALVAAQQPSRQQQPAPSASPAQQPRQQNPNAQSSPAGTQPGTNPQNQSPLPGEQQPPSVAPVVQQPAPSTQSPQTTPPGTPSAPVTQQPGNPSGGQPANNGQQTPGQNIGISGGVAPAGITRRSATSRAQF